MTNITTIVWLRQDLRLADHQALTDAARHGAVLPVYVYAPHEEGAWQPGAASRWWLHHSLEKLSDSLAARGLRLILRRGDSLVELRALLAESGATRVVWQRRYEPAATARDSMIKDTLRKDGATAESFAGGLLFEPWTLLNKTGGPYQVFTPFWRAALTRLRPSEPLAIPPTMSAPGQWPQSLSLDDLGLLPSIRWDVGLAQRWQPGENAAAERLADFVANKMSRYAEQRDLPAADATSLLSAALHFGELSPVQILHALRARVGWREDKFVAEVGWREFAHHLLFHFPHTPNEPLRPEYRDFIWVSGRDAERALRAWQQGRTGIPIVDAGMRELWTTGYMHNRVRMLVASFLVKNLRIDWREGARWFWDTLVDADLANNTQGWQWSAGCGADAAPYFRVFNPVLQAERFDPQAVYIKRWVPEFGTTSYPTPIVDLSGSREQAISAWRSMRAKIAAP